MMSLLLISYCDTFVNLTLSRYITGIRKNHSTYSISFQQRMNFNIVFGEPTRGQNISSVDKGGLLYIYEEKLAEKQNTSAL